MLTTTEDINWVNTKINKISDHGPFSEHVWAYELELPDFLACWDAFDDWEVARFKSMKDNLKQGMVLYDIGAETGWCSALYAQFVGAENMVLIEPTPEFWPNIKATMERNHPGKIPKACFVGLVGEQASPISQIFEDTWPPESDGPLIDKLSYRYIHEHGQNEGQQQIKIDFIAEDIPPDALTMDVEGAELLVLRGAKQTLIDHQPLVWVSVHPDLGERDYGVIPQQVHDFMQSVGYEHLHLGVDHESHEFYYPEGRVIVAP